MALVALGSLAAAHGAEGTRDHHLRSCALRALPALAELARACAQQGAQGDAALLGALLSLSEFAGGRFTISMQQSNLGVRVFSADGSLRTAFDDGAPTLILDCGSQPACLHVFKVNHREDHSHTPYMQAALGAGSVGAAALADPLCRGRF